jgi:hypothetical protein
MPANCACAAGFLWNLHMPGFKMVLRDVEFSG